MIDSHDEQKVGRCQGGLRLRESNISNLRSRSASRLHKIPASLPYGVGSVPTGWVATSLVPGSGSLITSQVTRKETNRRRDVRREADGDGREEKNIFSPSRGWQLLRVGSAPPWKCDGHHLPERLPT